MAQSTHNSANHGNFTTAHNPPPGPFSAPLMDEDLISRRFEEELQARMQTHRAAHPRTAPAQSVGAEHEAWSYSEREPSQGRMRSDNVRRAAAAPNATTQNAANLSGANLSGANQGAFQVQEAVVEGVPVSALKKSARTQNPEPSHRSLNYRDVQPLESTTQPVQTHRESSTAQHSAVSGSLFDTDVASLMARAIQRRETCELRIRSGQGEQWQLFFEQGRPVDITSSAQESDFASFLYHERYITRSQYSVCRAEPAKSPRQMAHFALSAGIIKPSEIFKAVRHYFEEHLLSLFALTQGSFELQVTAHAARASASKIVLPQSSQSIVMEGLRRHYTLDRLMCLVGLPGEPIHLSSAQRESLMKSSADLGLDSYERTICQRLLSRAVAHHNGAHPAANYSAQDMTIEELVLNHGLLETRVYQTLYALKLFDAVGIEAQQLEAVKSGLLAGTEIDKQRILEQHEACKRGNYFEILGVDPRASSVDIQRALGALKRAYSKERFSVEINQTLGEELGDITQSISEAAYVLENSQLRDAYAQHFNVS